MWRTVRVRMLDPTNMTLGHIDSSSLELLPKIFGFLVTLSTNSIAVDL